MKNAYFKVKLLNDIYISKSKNELITKYNTKFYQVFKIKTKQKLKEIYKESPNLKRSVFKLNYLYGIIYITWYKVFIALSLSNEESNENIWMLNENFLKKLPYIIRKRIKKSYLKNMIKNCPKHEKRNRNKSTNEIDWKLSYHKESDNDFRIIIYSCGLKKLCEKFHVPNMLPSICRMDYLNGYYMEYGFERNKTLGDGNTCCDNLFKRNGRCEWSPEKGFINRK